MLLQELDRAQFQPFLACPPELAALLRPDLPEDVEVLPIGFYHPAQLATALRFARFLRARRIHILHCHMFHASLVAAPMASLCRTPLAIETTHVRESWRHGFFKGRYVVDRIIARCTDRFIAVSESNAEYLKTVKRLPAAKIVTIQNGCDLRRFDPDYRSALDLRVQLGFGREDPVFVVIARLEPQKGHAVLLDAMKVVLSRCPNVRVVCVGDGSLRAGLERKASSLRLGDSVRFVGYQSNTPDWFALADATILPSFFEGLPLVAIESLAAGRPVVATEVDGTPEVVLNGKTGLTIPPGDPMLLAEAICLMAEDVGLRRALGRAGHVWAHKHFSRERQIEETENLYLSSWKERRGTRAAASLSSRASGQSA